MPDKNGTMLVRDVVDVAMNWTDKGTTTPSTTTTVPTASATARLAAMRLSSSTACMSSNRPCVGHHRWPRAG